GVVEVDVREQEVADLLQLDAACAEAPLQLLDAAGRAAVEQRGALVGVDEVRADDALRAKVTKIERFRGAKRARSTGRAPPRDRPRGLRPTRARPTGGSGSSERRRARRRSRRASCVLSPRRTSQQSNGPGTAPSDFCRNCSRSATVGSLVAANPPTTSECPPRYFVVECTTMSAPSSSGRWRYGVAKVLSTTTIAPAACAASAAARMSITC